MWLTRAGTEASHHRILQENTGRNFPPLPLLFFFSPRYMLRDKDIEYRVATESATSRHTVHLRNATMTLVDSGQDKEERDKWIR